MEPLRQWLNVATPLARNIVRKIIQDAHPEPIHTHRIFALSQIVQIDPEDSKQHVAWHARLVARKGPWPPPNPTHPIRSMRYLKDVVLKDLEDRNEIVIVPHKRPATEEEITLAKTLKKPTRSQRKNRGASGPGKRPVFPQDGMVTEFSWRLKEAGDEERERLKKEQRLMQKQKREEERERKKETRRAALQGRRERVKLMRLRLVRGKHSPGEPADKDY